MATTSSRRILCDGYMQARPTSAFIIENLRVRYKAMVRRRAATAVAKKDFYLALRLVLYALCSRANSSARMLPRRERSRKPRAVGALRSYRRDGDRDRLLHVYDHFRRRRRRRGARRAARATHVSDDEPVSGEDARVARSRRSQRSQLAESSAIVGFARSTALAFRMRRSVTSHWATLTATTMTTTTTMSCTPRRTTIQRRCRRLQSPRFASGRRAHRQSNATARRRWRAILDFAARRWRAKRRRRPPSKRSHSSSARLVSR